MEEHVITGLNHISQTGNKKVHTSTQNLGKESSSSWEAIKSGVPQGLILEPLLFLIHINDAPYGIRYTAKPVIYADNASVLITTKNINELQIEAKTYARLTA